MIRRIAVLAFSVAILSCAQDSDETIPNVDINDLARRYLFLELSMGRYDADHVDAYFGPEEIRVEAEGAKLSRDDILAGSAELAVSLHAAASSDDGIHAARIEGLLARLQALDTRIAMSKGEIINFDKESKLLFGTVAPHNDAEHFDAVVQKIDELLPGEGTLSARVDKFLEEFTIPDDKLSAVIDTAIAECRRRTLEFIDLPAGESFTVEYVTDKPWGGYNWYQGNSTSVIQINTDLPSRIGSAVVLGCHEGYPGHHVYNTLLEKNMVRGKGWLEFSLYPLFSPQSLIAEGSAEYGISLAFSHDERIEFEKNVLFPIAGLDAKSADRYYNLIDLQIQLDGADNEAARAYLDGDIDREHAIEWLVRYTLTTEERALKKTKFYDAYRSYVINYNHGKDMVGAYIERDTDAAAERWLRFETLLSTSVLPSDLEP